MEGGENSSFNEWMDDFDLMGGGMDSRRKGGKERGRDKRREGGMDGLEGGWMGREEEWSFC